MPVSENIHWVAEVTHVSWADKCDLVAVTNIEETDLLVAADQIFISE